MNERVTMRDLAANRIVSASYRGLRHVTAADVNTAKERGQLSFSVL